MCGRFTLQTTKEKLTEVFDLIDAPELDARYNLAPTDPVFVIRADDDDRRAGSLMRWGLVPRWAKDLKIGARMINARSETVHTLGAFKHSLQRRRCLVAADGWYEWLKVANGKQPYRFVMNGGEPMGLAGIWDEWTTPTGELLESVSVLTVAPNLIAAKVHDRMPLVLGPALWTAWLAKNLRDEEPIRAMLTTPPADGLSFYPVDRRVGNVRNDDEGLIARVSVPEQTTLF